MFVKLLLSSLVFGNSLIDHGVDSAIALVNWFLDIVVKVIEVFSLERRDLIEKLWRLKLEIKELEEGSHFLARCHFGWCWTFCWWGHSLFIDIGRGLCFSQPPQTSFDRETWPFSLHNHLSFISSTFNDSSACIRPLSAVLTNFFDILPAIHAVFVRLPASLAFICSLFVFKDLLQGLYVILALWKKLLGWNYHRGDSRQKLVTDLGILCVG